jgi:uncharacterized repeat protein (TIGR01451 family)
VVKEGNLLIHHGELITYTFDVSNSGNVPLFNVTLDDVKCESAITRDAANDKNADGDNALENEGTPDATKSEVWRFTCTAHAPADSLHDAAEENPILNTVTASAQDAAGNVVTASDTWTTTIIHPKVLVDKTERVGSNGTFVDGPVEAYVGDVLEYQFAVSNVGDTPLHDLVVSDPKCDGPVSGPTKTLGDDDGDLEAGEIWLYTCSHKVTEADGTNVHNVVTVTGTDPIGGPNGTPTDTDETDATILHPAIHIEKDGPATAQAGDKVTYTLVVTNPGDVAFIGQTLAVTDKLCDAPPTLVAKARGGADDPTPDTLDPGDSWAYMCTVTTQVGQTQVANVADVHGIDHNGHTADDSDDATTALSQPAIEVLPEVVVSGASKLSGPASCVKKAFNVKITGKQIASVKITIDGRRVKTFRNKAGLGKRFVLRINPAKYGKGIHRLKARVVYNAKSQTKPRTLQMSFERCVKQVIKPQFTG